MDPFGHRWSLGAHTQDLSKEQIEAAAGALFARMDETAQKPH